MTVPPTRPPAETEAGFTRAVIDLARVHGWRTAHFRPARTAKGWRTAVSGDGAGFPDLVLLRRSEMIVAELKVGRNKPTADQTAWLAAFAAAGVRRFVWTPDDWWFIAKTLRSDPS